MIGSAAGYCTIHKMPKMFVGTEEAVEPTCIRCRAAAEPKLGRDQTAVDPGEKFFNKNAPESSLTVKEAEPIKQVRRPVIADAGLTLAEIVERAVAELGNLPMPKDIKQFKKVQKVIKTLQSLMENQNG